jgi:hypothetical protein
MGVRLPFTNCLLMDGLCGGFEIIEHDQQHWIGYFPTCCLMSFSAVSI